MTMLSRFIRNPLNTTGLLIVAVVVLVAVLAPWLAPHDPYKIDPFQALKPPGGEYLLGTDKFGRDVLSRLLHGARISLLVGLIVTGISTTVGVIIGVVSGYYGGRIDSIFMRITDAFMTFPGIILALAVMASLGSGFWTLVLALALSGWSTFARLTRAETLAIREREFITASRAIGGSDFRLMFRHIATTLVPTLLVYASLRLAVPILSEASLSFLGLGLPAPLASWGRMIATDRENLSIAWWAVTFPGLAIMLVVLGFNLLGDGLRDTLDPKQKTS